MSFGTIARVAMTVALVALPAGSFAADILIEDAYARTSRPAAPTGAAFIIIRNTGSTDDRLVAATSEIAERVELHTHVDQGGGVMKMVEIEDGVPLPAGETYMMQRGGDHVMFMGLNGTLEQGAEITVTLTFEQAGDIVVTIPVDNERQPEHGGGHGQKTRKP
jgi:copper(I)-binding protein